jgi:hypothetical protein
VDAVEAAARAVLERPVALSAFGKTEALVCACKFSDEELCIIAALGGTDLKCD